MLQNLNATLTQSYGQSADAIACLFPALSNLLVAAFALALLLLWTGSTIGAVVVARAPPSAAPACGVRYYVSSDDACFAASSSASDDDEFARVVEFVNRVSVVREANQAATGNAPGGVTSWRLTTRVMTPSEYRASSTSRLEFPGMGFSETKV